MKQRQFLGDEEAIGRGGGKGDCASMAVHNASHPRELPLYPHLVLIKRAPAGHCTGHMGAEPAFAEVEQERQINSGNVPAKTQSGRLSPDTRSGALV